MTFSRITILFLIVFVLGCARSQPRYGVSESRPANTGSAVHSNSSVNTTIKFGRILQVYLGKPYAGRSRYDPGLDCSLFAGEVFKKYAKIELPRKSEDQFKAGEAVKNGQLTFGDLVFFNTDGQSVSHVGIYIGHEEFIHASTSNGVIISGMNEKHWAKRFMGARRVIK